MTVHIFILTEPERQYCGQKKVIEGVPHIEGLMFDSAKAKIGKKSSGGR